MLSISSKACYEALGAKHGRDKMLAILLPCSSELPSLSHSLYININLHYLILFRLQSVQDLFSFENLYLYIAIENAFYTSRRHIIHSCKFQNCLFFFWGRRWKGGHDNFWRNILQIWLFRWMKSVTLSNLYPWTFRWHDFCYPCIFMVFTQCIITLTMRKLFLWKLL